MNPKTLGKHLVTAVQIADTVKTVALSGALEVELKDKQTCATMSIGRQ